MPAESGDKQRCFIIVAQLAGAHDFVYRAGRVSFPETFRARVNYVQALLNYSLCKFFSQAVNFELLHIQRKSDSSCVILFADDSFAEKLAAATSEFNAWLLNKFDGDLYFSVAFDSLNLQGASLKGSEALIFSKLESLEAKIKQAEFEPFKNDLSSLFDDTNSSRVFEECDFCGRENLPCHDVDLLSRNWKSCSLCRELDLLQDVESNSNADNGTFAFIPQDYFDSKTQSASQSVAAPKIFFDEPSQSQNTSASLHFSFHSSARDFAPHLDSQSSDVKGLLKSEIDRVHASFMGAADANSLFVIEANNSDILVLGAVPELLELAFGLSKSIDSKYPDVNYSGGLSYALNAIPLPWLVRESVQMSLKAHGAGAKFFAVNFGAEPLNSSPCFSWANWRTEIKPLLEKIRYFEHLGALGFGFWDYLLDFSMSDSRAIYQLMYRLARREESHNVLRQDASWTQFKSDILLSLAGTNDQLIHKRNELKTALSWFLLFKRLSSHKAVPRELATIERK